MIGSVILGDRKRKRETVYFKYTYFNRGFVFGFIRGKKTFFIKPTLGRLFIKVLAFEDRLVILVSVKTMIAQNNTEKMLIHFVLKFTLIYFKIRITN